MWTHRVSQVDPVTRTGLCSACGHVKVKPRRKNGEIYRYACYIQINEESRRRLERKRRLRPDPVPRERKFHYTHAKMDKCARCGFVPEDSCQLDVDHIDGDHFNNNPANLQTLCANCHRLKTKQERKKPAPS